MNDPIPKKQKEGNPQGTFKTNTWHTLLKSNITSPIEVAGKTSISSVLKYCGKKADEFYPLIDMKCVPNVLF